MTEDTPRFGIPDALARRMSMPEQHEYLRAKLTRRRVLAGSAAGAAAAGTGLLTAGPAAASSPTLVTAPATTAVDGSLVAPFGRHLAFGADPKTRMRISWQVPFAVSRPYVRVGLRPWELGARIEAEVRPLHTPSQAPAAGPGHGGVVAGPLHRLLVPRGGGDGRRVAGPEGVRARRERRTHRPLRDPAHGLTGRPDALGRVGAMRTRLGGDGLYLDGL